MAASQSPAGTPAPADPAVPVKRGRGRPPKAETLARRKLEAEQAAAKAAALAASQPPPKAESPKPVIPEAVSDSEEPADVASDAVAAARAAQIAQQQQQQQQQQLQQQQQQARAQQLAQQQQQQLPRPVQQPAPLAGPSYPNFAAQNALQSMTAQSQPATQSILGKRLPFSVPARNPDTAIDSKSAKAIADMYTDMNEPLLATAIEMLSSGSCSSNALHRELAKLPEQLRLSASAVLPFDPPAKRFALHRGIPQADLFSSALSLTPDELALIAQSKDTDVLELAGPSYLALSKPPSLREVAPRPAWRRAPPPLHKTPQPVNHLYYSAFSSFAPTHDSSTSTLPYGASLSTELLAATSLAPSRTSILSPAESVALKSVGIDEAQLVSLLSATPPASASLNAGTGGTASEEEETDKAISLNLERLKALLTAQRNRFRAAASNPNAGLPIAPNALNPNNEEPVQLVEPGRAELAIAKALSASLTKLIARVSAATAQNSTSTGDDDDDEIVDGTQVKEEQEGKVLGKVVPGPEEVERAIERFKKQTQTRGSRGTVDIMNPIFSRPVKMS